MQLISLPLSHWVTQAIVSPYTSISQPIHGFVPDHRETLQPDRNSHCPFKGPTSPVAQALHYRHQHDVLPQDLRPPPLRPRDHVHRGRLWYVRTLFCRRLLPILVWCESHTLTVVFYNRASRVPVDQGQADRVEQVPLCGPVLPVLRHVWLGVWWGDGGLRVCLFVWPSAMDINQCWCEGQSGTNMPCYYLCQPGWWVVRRWGWRGSNPGVLRGRTWRKNARLDITTLDGFQN